MGQYFRLIRSSMPALTWKYRKPVLIERACRNPVLTETWIMQNYVFVDCRVTNLWQLLVRPIGESGISVFVCREIGRATMACVSGRTSEVFERSCRVRKTLFIGDAIGWNCYRWEEPIYINQLKRVLTKCSWNLKFFEVIVKFKKSVIVTTWITTL